MRAVIHSTKHYIQMTLTTVATGTRNTTIIASGVQSTVANLANEVEEGASVKAVFIELWAIGSVTNQFFTVTLDKTGAGASVITASQMTDLWSYPNKKNLLYVTQGLASNDGIAAPIPLMRGWYKIPKSKQRFGLGDALVLSIMSRGSDDIIFCGFVTYKEYT